MNSPLVTVYCATYNHRAFISQALDSILKQNTSFDFEIIVHDDASTDGTSEIVKEYADRYQKHLKAILQSENQYSKRKRIFYEQIIPLIRGKYVAYCEGDDYWIENNKLQRQVEYLERHPDCSACVHNTRVIEMNGGLPSRISKIRKECDLPLSLLLKENGAFHFNSIMNRKEQFEKIPRFLFDVDGVGDYPLRVYLGLLGPVHYFPQAMSAYRHGVPGSWTMRNTINPEKKVKTSLNIIKMLKNANKWSGGTYNRLFLDAILEQEYNIEINRGNFGVIFKDPFKKIFLRDRSFRHKLRIIYMLLQDNIIKR